MHLRSYEHKQTDLHAFSDRMDGCDPESDHGLHKNQSGLHLLLCGATGFRLKAMGNARYPNEFDITVHPDPIDLL
jgi:hypothetical protein